MKNQEHQEGLTLERLRQAELKTKAVTDRLIKLQDKLYCLEAICLIHGINDISMWFGKGKDILQNEAIEAHQTGEHFIPVALRKHIKYINNEINEELNKG